MSVAEPVAWQYLERGHGRWKVTRLASYAAELATNPRNVVQALYLESPARNDETEAAPPNIMALFQRAIDAARASE